MYHKKHQQHGKLDKKWSPYNRVIDQTGPVTFVVWNQINGRVKRAHANDLKLAGLEEWEVPKEKEKIHKSDEQGGSKPPRILIRSQKKRLNQSQLLGCKRKLGK